MLQIKKFLRRHRSGIIVLGVLFLAYQLLMCTRFTACTKYIPFTGRVFFLDPAEVEQVTVENWDAGRREATIQEKEDMERVIEQLNSFRFQWWHFDLPVATGGNNPVLRIETSGGSCEYELWDDGVKVNGLWYRGEKGFFQELAELPLCSSGEA